MYFHSMTFIHAHVLIWISFSHTILHCTFGYIMYVVVVIYSWNVSMMIKGRFNYVKFLYNECICY